MIVDKQLLQFFIYVKYKFIFLFNNNKIVIQRPILQLLHSSFYFFKIKILLIKNSLEVFSQMTFCYYQLLKCIEKQQFLCRGNNFLNYLVMPIWHFDDMFLQKNWMKCSSMVQIVNKEYPTKRFMLFILLYDTSSFLHQTHRNLTNPSL